MRKHGSICYHCYHKFRALLLHTYSSSLLITCLTTLINFHALSLIFLPISPPLRFFISDFVQLWNSKHTSQHPHFRHIKLLVLCFLHCPCLGTVHHCSSYNCLIYFPIDSQTYSSVTQNPDTYFHFFHHDCMLYMHVKCVKLLCNILYKHIQSVTHQ